MPLASSGADTELAGGRSGPSSARVASEVPGVSGRAMSPGEPGARTWYPTRPPRRAVRRATDRAETPQTVGAETSSGRGAGVVHRTDGPIPRQPASSAHGWAMRSLARSAASAAIGVALAATLAASLPQPSGQAGGAPPVTTSVPYRAPVEGAVLRLFDAPAQRWSSGHRGVDLAAGVGEVVRSPAAGRVSSSATVVDRGVVTLTH